MHFWFGLSFSSDQWLPLEKSIFMIRRRLQILSWQYFSTFAGRTMASKILLRSWKWSNWSENALQTKNCFFGLNCENTMLLCMMNKLLKRLIYHCPCPIRHKKPITIYFLFRFMSLILCETNFVIELRAWNIACWAYALSFSFDLNLYLWFYHNNHFINNII